MSDTPAASRSRGIAHTSINIVLLATCLLVAGHLFERARASGLSYPHPAERREIDVGQAADHLPGVSYHQSSSTLVLYVRSSCKYCTASMPFYRRLNELRSKGGVRLVAVSPEPANVADAYLRRNGVAIDQIVSYSGRVHATPTLIEVNQGGEVTNVWVGQQTEEQQRKITNAVKWQ